MTSMNEVVLVMGFPASGKSTLSEGYKEKGYVHLNRDKAGGRVVALVPKMVAELKAGKSVVLDNLFRDVESRAPFIEAAKKLDVPIRCEWMSTSIEDSQINAMHRMCKKYKQVLFSPSDISSHDRAKNDPNTFPIAVFFVYRKNFEKPTLAEGFKKVDIIKFKRKPLGDAYKNKAVFFDYDDTLRRTTGKQKFPTKPEEVEILAGRAAKLKQLQKEGYKLLGVSNQAGIARGQVTQRNALACFEHTNRLLGVDIEYAFCPHNVPPNCYCRKPQSGIGVHFIEKYKLDPSQCIMVGDQTTDSTFAKRLGIKYVDQKDFFK